MTYLDVPSVSTEPLASVLNTLRLERRGDGSYRCHTNLRQLSKRVYGGQVLAQAVLAATDTFTDPQQRLIHSQTAAFLAPGKTSDPIDIDVEVVNDGRSFSTRRVFASQGGRTIFTARDSFQLEQDGVDHGDPTPEVPWPDELTSSVDIFASVDHPAARFMSSTNAIDMRHVEGNIYLHPSSQTQATTHIWFKTRSALPEGTSQPVQRALLAYSADQFMLEPIMAAHGLCWSTPGISLATLDHSSWWHRDVDVSDWILAELHSPSAQGGRGLTLAKFHQNGKLVATMAQEGMVRIPDGTPTR